MLVVGSITVLEIREGGSVFMQTYLSVSTMHLSSYIFRGTDTWNLYRYGCAFTSWDVETVNYNNFIVIINYKSSVCRVMIIDLDAHQGNGHEKDFSDDSMILHL